MTYSSSGDLEPSVVLDTNVFVAAEFNPDSASARIVEAVRAGHLRMAWNEDTRTETEHVLRQIPPLSWRDVSDLFHQEWREEKGRTDAFDHIPDPADRKFAALAAAAGSVLVTQDDHLLAQRERSRITVLTPREFEARHELECGMDQLIPFCSRDFRIACIVHVERAARLRNRDYNVARLPVAGVAGYEWR